MSHPFVLITLQPPIPTTLIVPTQQTLEIRLYRSIIAGRVTISLVPYPKKKTVRIRVPISTPASLSLSSLRRSVTPYR
jgi:hypothetical protein